MSFRPIRRTVLPATVLRTTVLLAAVLLLTLPVAAAEQTRTLERSFTVGSGETLKLANLAGHLTLVAGEGDAVEVVAEIHAEGRTASRTEELLDGMEWVRHEDGWALSYPVERFDQFRYPKREEGIFGWGSSTTTRYLGRRVKVSGSGGPTLYADLTITYPARVPLRVRQPVGRVEGGDLYGDLGVDTGSGDVTIDSFNGDIDVDTGSGDILVGSFRGRSAVFDTGSGDVQVHHVDAERVSADTGSGDVELRDGRIGDLVADTGSGDVTVDGVDVVTADMDTGSGDVLLRGDLSQARSIVGDTGSGDVEIYGGPDFEFHVRADQGSGDLRVGYDDAALQRDGREIVGATRGSQRTKVVIDTGSGDGVVAP